MTDGPFVLTAEERNKLEAAMLESKKVLEGVPGALADVRARAYRRAASMAVELADEIGADCERHFAKVLATRLRAEAGEG